VSNLFATDVKTSTFSHAYMQSLYLENFHIEVGNSSTPFPTYET